MTEQNGEGLKLDPILTSWVGSPVYTKSFPPVESSIFDEILDPNNSIKFDHFFPRTGEKTAVKGRL